MHPLFQMKPVLSLSDNDYIHGRHAGNLGDTTKHLFLCTLLSVMFNQRRANGVAGPFRYLETHSGGVSVMPGFAPVRERISRLRGVNDASPYIYGTGGISLAEEGYFSSWVQANMLARRWGIPIKINAMDIVKSVVDANKAVNVPNAKVTCGSGWEEASKNSSAYDFIFIDPPYKDFGKDPSDKSLPQDWKRINLLAEEMVKTGVRGLIWMPYYTSNSARNARLPNLPLIEVYDAQENAEKENTNPCMNRVIKGSAFYAPGFTQAELQHVISLIKADPVFAKLGNKMTARCSYYVPTKRRKPIKKG